MHTDIGVRVSSIQKTIDQFLHFCNLAFRFCQAVHLTNGVYGGISYRYLHDRPGNPDNSLTASGYFISDAAINYRHNNYELGISVENLFNSTWNESQVAYTARLKNEPQAVEQISYTPGVPFYPKLKFAVFFK